MVSRRAQSRGDATAAYKETALLATDFFLPPLRQLLKVLMSYFHLMSKLHREGRGVRFA
jgi:hypothetical protein